MPNEVGEEVVGVDAFYDVEECEKEPMTSPNWPGLCAAEVLVRGYTVASEEECGRTEIEGWRIAMANRRNQ